MQTTTTCRKITRRRREVAQTLQRLSASAKLPSWPKPSGGVAAAPARIAGTASRLLQAERKKNVSHQGNVCGASLRRPRGDGLPLTATSARKCSEQRLHHAGRICKL